MEPVETFEHDGVTVEIHQDYDAGDPFEQYDQLAELVWTEREHAYKNVNGHVSIDHEHYLDPDRFTSVAHMQRYLTLMERYLIAIPFRLIDYGSNGYRAMLTDETDERTSGFVVVSEANREKVGAPMEGLRDNALGDWRMWKAWVEGDVYYFHAGRGWPESECIGGFYGADHEQSGLMEEAKSIAEGIADERARQRALPWLPTFGNPIRKAATT